MAGSGQRRRWSSPTWSGGLRGNASGLVRRSRRRALPAAGRILHLFDLLSTDLAEPGYRGSPFVNACVELGSNHPAAAVARGHRQWLLDTLTALAAETAAPAPEVLAAQLLQLYEGATLATQIGGDTDAAQTAKAAAETLLSLPRQPGPAVADAPRARPRGASSARGQPGGAPAGAFLNSAHLPDGDDKLTDERAGPWLVEWLTDARGAAPAGSTRSPGSPRPPPDLLVLREGLRQLAAVNCGGQADAHAVAARRRAGAGAPLLVDLADGAGRG